MGNRGAWFADSKIRQSAMLHLRSKHSRQCLCFCLEVQVRGLAAYRPQFSNWHNWPSCDCASHKMFLYLCIAHCQDICIWSYPVCCFSFHTLVSFFVSFAIQCRIYIYVCNKIKWEWGVQWKLLNLSLPLSSTLTKIYLSILLNIFVQFAKCICPYCKMYLS